MQLYRNVGLIVFRAGYLVQGLEIVVQVVSDGADTAAHGVDGGLEVDIPHHHVE